MGTTKTALEAGSTELVYVVAIEGYNTLLTNASTAASLTAWTLTDWTGVYASALGGLFVQLDLEQSIDPWDAFKSTGGDCTLTVVADAADTFGIAVNKKASGAETYLTETADRDDGTITVKSTSGFDSSGFAFIGTECFQYSGVTATTFTGCTRGVYSPFGNGQGSNKFAEHHRVGSSDSGIKLQPVVSSQPRVWIGKRVGVWMHRVVGGVLDVKTEAECVFAGRIVEIRDDPASASTVVVLKHDMEYLKVVTLGRDMWRGELLPGVHLRDNDTFELEDGIGDFGNFVLGGSTANPLVVTTGASGANEMEPGYYTHDEIYSALNTWLTSELAATRITGTYLTGIAPNGNGELKAFIDYTPPAVAGTVRYTFHLRMRAHIAKYLGWSTDESPEEPFTVSGAANDGVTITRVAPGFPLATVIVGGGQYLQALVINETGTFVSQTDNLPSACIIDPQAAVDGITEWGIFLIDNKFAVFAARDGDELKYIRKTGTDYGGSDSANLIGFAAPSTGETVEIRQIFVFQDTFASLLKKVIFSTGASTYNHPTWDTLGYSLSLGIPGCLLGRIEDSIDELPGATQSIVMIIDKPTKFIDLFAGDLLLRRAFVRWVSGSGLDASSGGGYEFKTWLTPTAGAAVAALTESNKMAPSGNQDPPFSACVETDEWQVPIVKIDYNRDITAASGADAYRSSITFEDRVAVDDSGGEGRIKTIKARNIYRQFAGAGAGVEELAPGYLAFMPVFSRPLRRLTRSISSREFTVISVGDVVTVTDEQARDPVAGTRGISTRPATVTKVRYSFGGNATPGQREPDAMGGEVELFFIDLNRLTAYVPSAQVDETATTAGYVAGTKTLTVYAHKYSESSEAVDASYFPATYKVRVVEIDPADPTSPQAWNDTVASQTGNTIVLTTGLAGWDTSKRYRVTWQPYTSCVAAQQVYTFQADDADGYIQDTGQPFQYGSYAADATYTVNSPGDDIELVPDECYGDGKPRDVGHEIALIRLANNLIDFKTAHHCAQLSTTVLTGAGAEPGIFRLVSVTPIFLTQEILSHQVYRTLECAPWFRSSSGVSASIRVTLSRTLTSSTGVDSVDRGSIYQDATWTTSSTTWQTPAPEELKLNVKNLDGIAWLYIECTSEAETRGLARATETYRVIV